MEIITNLLCGTVDSIKGIKTLFYLDQEMKARNASRILLEQQQQQQQQQKGESPTKKQRSGSATPVSNCDKNKSADENSVSKRVFQCCALNGGIFFLSIAFKNYILMHGIRHIVDIIYGDVDRSARMWRYIEPTLDGFFGVLWIMPLFLLSRTVNSLWFQDIADSAFKIRKGRPQLFPSISKFIADVLMSLLVQCLFLGQIWLVKFVPHPYLARAVSFIHLALLYSLYSFEYKWFNMGWELHKRLTYIEYNWPYFLGFGIPLAILTELPSDFFVSGCVFSTLFPLFIISGNEASPKAITYDFPIKIFSPVILISNLIIKFNYYKIFNLWCKTSTPAHRSNSSSSSSYSYNANATPSSVTPSSSSRSTPVPTMAQIQRRTRNLR
ncbi:etoposide-induced protein 2.4 homolog [Culicoides brevitarsis]|uniref:etoposide-induced protein 2.4 homolog n=1 Tax=Culicoides brevitarsis TaxID=469753 RepID=UPI00307C274B